MLGLHLSYIALILFFSLITGKTKKAMRAPRNERRNDE
jgi:hypothetical protein